MANSGYNEIATEYYDRRHVTSRNFDAATKAALLTEPFTIPNGVILEIGAGRGRAGEFLGAAPSQVIQLDSSETMLELLDREACVIKILADACSIPLAARQFSAVVGFLIDPFMGLDALGEAHRVLIDNGELLLTVPTQMWGSQLRTNLGIDVMTTRFKKVGTEQTVVLPSILHSPNQISDMLSVVGFRDIRVSSHSLPADTAHISPDIESVCAALSVVAAQLPIIHIVRATK